MFLCARSPKCQKETKWSLGNTDFCAVLLLFEQKDKIYIVLTCASLSERQKREPNGLDLPYENIITLALMCWALIVAKVYVCKHLCINLYKTIL